MEQNETKAGYILLAVSVSGGIVDEALRKRLDGVNPEEWVPSELIENLIRRIESDNPEKVKTMGRAIMYAGRTSFLKPLEPLSPSKLLSTFNDSYLTVNRGPNQGGYRILSLEKGRAVMEATDPYGEYFTEGLLSGGLRVAGAQNVTVEKRRARSRRDEADEFVITWEE